MILQQNTTMQNKLHNRRRRPLFPLLFALLSLLSFSLLLSGRRCSLFFLSLLFCTISSLSSFLPLSRGAGSVGGERCSARRTGFSVCVLCLFPSHTLLRIQPSLPARAPQGSVRHVTGTSVMAAAGTRRTQHIHISHTHVHCTTHQRMLKSNSLTQTERDLNSNGILDRCIRNLEEKLNNESNSPSNSERSMDTRPVQERVHAAVDKGGSIYLCAFFLLFLAAAADAAAISASSSPGKAS